MRAMFRNAVLAFSLLIFVSLADAETPGVSGLQGGGAVFFYAEPGELVIELEKQDLFGRRDWNQDFLAVLTAPDRTVVAETVIPDYDFRRKEPRPADRSPPQTARLAVDVPAAGVYKMLLTVAQDSYGRAVVWGFRTNCPRYLIDPGMGHRDSARRDPIMLNGDDSPGAIVFLPPAERFSISATNLPPATEPLRLYDAADREIATLQPQNGAGEFAIPENAGDRSGPWRLFFPQRKGHFEIDGLTRWKSAPAPAFWTNRADGFFPLHKHRWLIAPGRAAGDFVIRNDAESERTIQLAVEFPADVNPWPVNLPVREIRLGSGESQTVSASFKMPNGKNGYATHRFHLRAIVAEDDFTTYSSAVIRAEKSPTAGPLSMPIALKPYAHEKIQFGYQPMDTATSELYFDGNNRPFFLTDSGIARRDDRGWEFARVPENGTFRTPFSRIGINRENHLQLIATVERRPAYLHSADGGKTFSATLFPQGIRGHFEIETWNGHNTSVHPLPVLRYRRTGRAPRDPAIRWGVDHDLELYLPRLTNDGIELGDPVSISRHGIGSSAHSGIPVALASRGELVHIVWGETSAPEENAPGVPTKVATYDRRTGKLSEPVLVGHAPPANDVHNTPSLLIDSNGFLHVLIGAHNRPFQYTRSLQPHTADGGWSPPEIIDPGSEQTYVGAVFDSRDTLHLVYRIWRRGEKFPGLFDTALVHQQKPIGGDWTEPRLLVTPPLPHYSVYYHRLTIDREDRLFLSYDYWSTWSAYRAEIPGGAPAGNGFGRTLLFSADSGKTWRFAPIELPRQ